MAKIPHQRSKHWRERAEKARAVAKSKQSMLRIAADYEELARWAERRLAQTQSENPKGTF
jgi:hypothetical protein